MSREGLSGRRILIVEDEYMIADEIATDLTEAGAEVVGPVPSVTAAWEIIERGERLDMAVLDVNLGGEMVWPVLDALVSRAVPILLATGYDEGAVPAAYAHLARCEKPVNTHDLLPALLRLLARAE